MIKIVRKFGSSQLSIYFLNLIVKHDLPNRTFRHHIQVRTKDMQNIILRE